MISRSEDCCNSRKYFHGRVSTAKLFVYPCAMAAVSLQVAVPPSITCNTVVIAHDVVAS